MTTWTDKLLDEATLFWHSPKRGIDGYIWEPPTEILGRWQYSVGGGSGPTVRYTQEGSVIVGRTSVWVNYDIEPGMYLWKGSQDDLVSDIPPPDDARQVVTIQTVRSIPSKTTKLRKVYLDES